MSQNDILLIIACLPGLIIGNYVYKKDVNKEPKKVLKSLVIGGIFSAILAIVISIIIAVIYPSFSEPPTDLLELIPYVFLGIALVEEFSKWIFLYFRGYKNIEYDEIYDMIVYAIFLGLGFATFENIFYIFDATQGGVLTGILRAVLSVPGHACYAVFMGCFMTLAKISSLNGKKSDSIKYLIFSIVVPTIAHGIYDYCLFTSSDTFLILFGIFLIAMYIISIKEIKKFAKNNYIFKRKYCVNCGNLITNTFCTSCGRKAD